MSHGWTLISANCSRLDGMLNFLPILQRRTKASRSCCTRTDAAIEKADRQRAFADLLSLEFPVFTAENPAPEQPSSTVEEWAAWLEEARKLQSPAALEAWLRDPNS